MHKADTNMHARDGTDMAMQTRQACPTEANMHHCPIPVGQQGKVLKEPEIQRHACRALNRQAMMEARNELPACPRALARTVDLGPAG
jgi:hypothetical protein